MLRRLIIVLLANLLPLAGVSTAAPQAGRLPGCEAASVVQRALDIAKRPAPGQLRPAWATARMKQLEDMTAKYPREYEPARRMFQLVKWDLKEQLPGLRDRWVKDAVARPKDPLALALAGLAQYEHDTDAAIGNLKQARKVAPSFAWPALQLADIYSSGRRMDKAEAGRQLSAFFAACPASTDDTALWLLPKVGGPDMIRKVATVLRADLARTSEPARLRRFETLWSLEFRTRPVTEHAALREQVAKDIRRLDAANRKPDAEWLIFLREGSKQAGASKDVQRASFSIEGFPPEAADKPRNILDGHGVPFIHCGGLASSELAVGRISFIIVTFRPLFRT